MDGALAVLQQNAVPVTADGCQPDDGHPGIVTDMSHAVFTEKVGRGDVQLLGHLEDVHRTQDNVFPMGAAFAALVAVKLKGIVQANGHGLDLFHIIEIHDYSPFDGGAVSPRRRSMLFFRQMFQGQFLEAVRVIAVRILGKTVLPIGDHDTQYLTSRFFEGIQSYKTIFKDAAY